MYELVEPEQSWFHAKVRWAVMVIMASSEWGWDVGREHAGTTARVQRIPKEAEKGFGAGKLRMSAVNWRTCCLVSPSWRLHDPTGTNSSCEPCMTNTLRRCGRSSYA